MQPANSDSFRSTCSFKKSDGALCRRSIQPDEEMCWQHAKTWHHKWRSLTRSQSTTFILTVLGVFLTTTGLFLPLVGSKHPPRQRDVEVGSSEIHPTADKVTAVVKRPEQQVRPTTPELQKNPKERSGSATRKPKNIEATKTSTEQQSDSATAKPANTPAMEGVDWHDKHNWRKNLRVGMTRTEVRRLFGEPEKMSVFSDTEFWDYGTGQITFIVKASSPDGALYSWYEPRN
jgi:hypothetical protein